VTGRRVIVHGLVQGVGFRWSCLREAQHLGLTGWVRNVPDGSVELSLHGDDASMRAMLDWLHSGPRGAYVEALQQRDETEPAPGGFEILD
jgi:acylphosphatase